MVEDPTPRTPQEAAEGFRHGMIERDWERALAYLTRDMQKGAIGSVCMGAAYAVQGDPAKGESLTEILDRHGLLGEGKMPDSTDLASIFRELMDWSEANLVGDKLVDLAGAIAASTYSDFRISGEVAYARQSGPQGESEARFRKVDGFWYLGE